MIQIRQGVTMVAGILAVAGMLVGGIGNVVGAVSCPEGAIRSSADNAADCNVPEAGSGSQGQTVNNAVQSIVTVLVAIAGIISVLAIIYGGFQMVTSAGDAGKVKTGREAAIYGLIGLVVAAGAWMLINFVFVVVAGGSSGG